MTLKQRRPQRQRGKRLSFDALLASLSARFVNVPSENLDAEIVDAQRCICECLRLDLSALWQREGDNSDIYLLTHLYRPRGGPPTPERMDAREYFPWCVQQLLAGNVVSVSCLDKLPSEAARDVEVWRYYGVKTTLTIPLSTGGGPLFAFLSFNTIREERDWPDTLVKRLTLIAQIFANALARKRSEESLRASEEINRVTFEQAAVGIAGVGSDGRWLRVNDKLCAILGYSREELMQLTFQDITYPEDIQKDLEYKDGMLSGKVKTFSIEKRYFRKDQSVVWANVTVSLVRTAAGESQYFIAVIEDITERKKAEAAVTESAERFRQVVENISDFVWEVDANGLYTYASSSVEKILGYSCGDLVGKMHFYDLFDPAVRDKLKAAAFRVFENKQAFRSFSNPNVSKNGRVVQLETSGVPVLDKAGNLVGYRGADTDITERKQSEEVRVRLSGLLINAQEQERASIARELHDHINQRLALLAIEIEEFGHSVAGLLPERQNEIRKLWNLTTEISHDVQVLSHQLHSSQLQHLGLVSAIDSLCQEFKKTKGMKVEFSCYGTPVNIKENASLALFRMVQEALRNAAKYSRARNVKVELAVEREELFLTVSDDGVGFDPQAVPGTGLGLISMQERMRLIGGELSIRSAPGAGTCIGAKVRLVQRKDVSSQSNVPVQVERQKRKRA